MTPAALYSPQGLGAKGSGVLSGISEEQAARLSQIAKNSPWMWGGISGLQPGDTVTGPGPSFSDVGLNAVSSPGLLSGGEPNRGDGGRPAGRRRNNNPNNLDENSIYNELRDRSNFGESGKPDVWGTKQVVGKVQDYGANGIVWNGVNYADTTGVDTPEQLAALGIPTVVGPEGRILVNLDDPASANPYITLHPKQRDTGFMEGLALLAAAYGGGQLGMGLTGAGAGAGATTGAGDLGWAANLTDAAGGSLASPELAGAAYSGLGEAGAGSLLQSGVDPMSWTGADAGNPGAPGSFADTSGLGYGASDGLSAAQVLNGAGTSLNGGGGTKLSELLGITGDSAKYADLLGKLLPAGLGAYASSKQADAYTDLANEYKEYGAPYRKRLSDLYADPSGFLSSKEVTVPVQQGTDIMARSLSTRGNPTGSGNALQQLQSYSTDQLFGKLGTEKDRLAGFGGLSNYNSAAPAAAAGAIGQNGNMWNSIGGGMADIFNPPKTAAQSLAELQKMMGGR